MKAPQFREMKVADLAPSPHNPPSRTTPDAIRGLVSQIGAIGLMQPILVAGNTIVDGHRRVAVYKELGYETIPAIVATGDPAKIYASVNGTSRKISGNESLQIYLVNAEAVMPLVKARLDQMTGDLGAARVRKLAKQGMSHQTYNRARQIVKYCDQDPGTIPEIFDWLLSSGSTHAVVAAMQSGTPAATLLRAVRAGRPLRMTAVVSD